jgi:hypothetical protein
MLLRRVNWYSIFELECKKDLKRNQRAHILREVIYIGCGVAWQMPKYLWLRPVVHNP